MKSDATLEDYQNREEFLITYLAHQIKKQEKYIEKYNDLESHGKRSAYKDILFKLTKE